MCIIWSTIIIICAIFSCFSLNPQIVLESITNSSKSALDNILVIASMLLFWSGIFNILSSTNLVKVISSKIYKFISFLFKSNEVSEKSKEYISLNVVSNLLGVGNAATINSLKGIEELQKDNKNKKKLNKSMATFILLNTSSIQIIPTSMITLRTLYNSSNPQVIFIPVIIVSVISLIISLLSLQLLWRFYD